MEVIDIWGRGRTLSEFAIHVFVQTPKAKNAYRQVDLHSSAADWLRTFIGDRKEGFIFQNANKASIHQSNFLRRSLHPTMEKLGIEKQGFHGFRRFRVTHLESNNVPHALVKYWTGHAQRGAT